MEYLASASNGLPPPSATLMKRGIVTQTGWDAQHHFLAEVVGKGAIADAVVLVLKTVFSRSEDEVIELKSIW